MGSTSASKRATASSTTRAVGFLPFRNDSTVRKRRIVGAMLPSENRAVATEPQEPGRDRLRDSRGGARPYLSEQLPGRLSWKLELDRLDELTGSKMRRLDAREDVHEWERPPTRGGLKTDRRVVDRERREGVARR